MTKVYAVRAALFGLAVGGLTLGGLMTALPARAAETDPVVARVNGQEIRKSDVLRAISTLPAQLRQMPLEVVFPPMLEQVIGARLIVAAGYKDKLAGDPEVKEKMKQAEERAVQEVYITRAVKARLSEDTVQARYQRYLKENPPQDEVRARHILVGTEAEAKEILGQLKGGADFAALAKQKSTDTAAAAQGGDLGYFTKDTMVAEFADAAFSGTPGKTLEQPVHTQFGWHVIRVEDRRKTTPRPLDDVRGELEGELSQDVIHTLLQELRSKSKVEQFQIDGSPLPAK